VRAVADRLPCMSRLNTSMAPVCVCVSVCACAVADRLPCMSRLNTSMAPV
jgi:hypothetical protein